MPVCMNSLMSRSLTAGFAAADGPASGQLLESLFLLRTVERCHVVLRRTEAPNEQQIFPNRA